MNETLLRPAGRFWFTIVFVVFFVQSIFVIWPGAIAINAHEGDTLHVAGVVLRMVDGENPHFDFLTPLGVMAFAPLAWLVARGVDLADAMLWCNVALDVCLLPVLYRLGESRLGPATAPAFALCVLAIGMAIVHGGESMAISTSMHYNRWSWAAMLPALAMAVLPPRQARPWLDGGLIGLLLGFLALVKMTFFVVAAPLVLVALAQRGDREMIAGTLLAGLAVAVLAMAGFGGPAFFAAYAQDLIFVAQSEIRPSRSISMFDMLAGPGNITLTIIVISMVLVLRLSGQQQAGLWLLLALPAFAFVTRQNWGQDPIWLVLVIVLALRWVPLSAGRKVLQRPADQVIWALALCGLVLIAPVIKNMALSPLRNAAADTSSYMPILSDPQHAGLLLNRNRYYGSYAVRPVERTGDPLERAGAAGPPLSVAGQPVPDCQLSRGYMGALEVQVEGLRALGLQNEPVAVLESVNAVTLWGGFPRVPGMPVWDYGETDYWSQIRYFLIPACTPFAAARDMLSHELDARYPDLELVASDPLFLLFRRP